jgi:HK97 family phage prohead protease
MGAEGLAWANYRFADGNHHCGDCAFYVEGGECRMFETPVDPLFVCDEWAPKPEPRTRMDAIDERAVWSTAYINALPDSAFLYVEKGEKDSEGKTTPRSKRHFPYKNANGDVDLAHLRNAIAQAPKANLPQSVKDEVQAKARKLLAQHGGEKSASTEDTEFRFAVAPITHVEVRDPTANPDDTWTMSGYAAVFNRSTVLYDGSFLVRSEEIDPGFFDPIFRDQQLSQPEGVVHFNYGHDMLSSVAASDVPAGQPGSLVLRSDAHGLHFLAKVPRDDPDGVRMAAKMRSGVLKQASFAFTIAEKQTSTRELDDGRVEERDRLLRAGRLYDVCATPQGAYPQTVSSLRSYAAALGQSTSVEAISVSPDFGGAPTINAEQAGRAARKRQFEAQIMRDELRRKYRK